MTSFRPGLFAALLATGALCQVSARPVAPDSGPLTSAMTAGGSAQQSSSGQATATAADGVATSDEVKAACATCHPVPSPDVLPRSAWRDTIARMMLIRDNRPEPAGPIGTAGRMVLLSPDMLRVLRSYLAHAPERLPDPVPWPETDPSGFVVHGFSAANAPPLPAISHVRFLDLDGSGRIDVVGCDMRQGVLVAGRALDPKGRLDVIGRVLNPGHFQLFDFDHDGARDLLVADLGSFQPADHTNGAVVWMRRTPGPTRKYAPLRLDGWPRVSDVEPADFNGDGKPDLAVAAFGWRKVGQLTVLENTTTNYAAPSFTPHLVDPRPGSIHAVPVDMTGDGRLDIVALFAQQYESVVLFENTGGFSFTPHVLYAGPHPNWGSSGLQVVDLDGDKDLDVLFTHGDTFDDQIVKPYHGIQWLENKGDGNFVEHDIAELPGVLRAQAADLDGDGDLDIVACTLFAGGGGRPQNPAEDRGEPSLVWLEQTTPGTFVRHVLERKPPRHATLDLADMDGDGDVDILVGNFLLGQEGLPWMEVWENVRKRKHEAVSSKR